MDRVVKKSKGLSLRRMTNRFLRQAGLYVKKTESGYRLKKLSVFRLDEKAFDYLSPEMKKLVGWGYGDKSNVTNLQRKAGLLKFGVIYQKGINGLHTSIFTKSCFLILSAGPQMF